MTDGPFIETKEVLGGYSVIEADTIDEAVEIAKTWPGVDKRLDHHGGPPRHRDGLSRRPQSVLRASMRGSWPE